MFIPGSRVHRYFKKMFMKTTSLFDEHLLLLSEKGALKFSKKFLSEKQMTLLNVHVDVLKGSFNIYVF